MATPAQANDSCETVVIEGNGTGSDMVTPMQTDDSHETLALEENGDVTFVFKACDEYLNGLHLVLSSKTMRSTSTFFRKLSGPDFKEGRQLAEDGHIQILATDETDSAQGAVFLCRLLHYDVVKDEEITHLVLARIAAMADKWDCLRMTKCFALYWLHRLIRDPYVNDVSKAEGMNLATVAYLYDFKHEFVRFTLFLILQVPPEVPETGLEAEKIVEIHESLQDVFGIIDRVREYYVERMTALFEDMIVNQNDRRDRYPEAEWCEFLDEQADMFLYFLENTEAGPEVLPSKRSSLWRSMYFKRLSLCNILEGLRFIDLEEINTIEMDSDAQCGHSCRGKAHCYKDCLESDGLRLRQAIPELVISAHKMILDLKQPCLECCKSINCTGLREEACSHEERLVSFEELHESEWARFTARLGDLQNGDWERYLSEMNRVLRVGDGQVQI